ncbi:MAG TPA: molybdate ABC transporter substrate-binding protein [Candidatus Eisenbacteria bacterium]|nr:molybdate ABC transporter substrate-binding protein [Candidatus Eisenbacteria bacterium]
MPALAEDFTVSVAASFRDVGAAISSAFEKEHPGVKVTLNNGPSGMLARQIEDGAPVDVFVSAGWPEIERLRAKSLVAGEPVVVARNELVLVVPKGSPWIGKDPKALLTSPDVKRIASGDPATVPFGAYAKQALTVVGLWDAVSPRMVFASEVRQALTYADEGAVDAAIVYATDARIAKSAIVLGEVPGSADLRIETVAVRTTRAPAEPATGFLVYLTSPTARAILAAAGFLPVDR